MNPKSTLKSLSLATITSIGIAACTATQPVVQQPVVQPPQQVTVVVTAPPQQLEVTRVVPQEVQVAKGAFTVPNPKLTDIRVRQAMAYCSDRVELVKSVYPLVPEEEQKKLVAHSFIPSTHWAYAGDSNLTVYPFDLEKGKAMLDEAGWKLPDGAEFRVNAAGEELFMKFTTTSAAFRQTWAAVWENQMKNCGIRVIRQHVPASWWFGDTTGNSRRDFELGAWAWVGQPDPGGQTLYACDQIPFPENGWIGQNYMGWCNEAATKGIKDANNTLNRDERIAAYKTVQQEFSKDMISLPLFARTNVFAINPGLQGFDPKVGDENFIYNIYDWEIPGKDTLVLGWTQEPASMWTLVESAQVAQWAYALIGGYAWTSPGYDYTPGIQTPMSTIENKLATNDDVEVKAGDKVYDVNGKAVDLAGGVKVKDASGAEVEFNGTPIKMKQLKVQYRLVEGLKWSDGEPLKKADWELGFKTDCDRESGATSFITCEQVQDIQFQENGVDVAYFPGVQTPTYFALTSPFTIYPSHRVIESEGAYKGKTLSEVPAKDWSTLPEIAEKPIDVGPYVLKEWVKGEKMVFEANPFFYKGAPKTKNVIISFITPENAEAQLIGGQVDVLDFTTLTALTESLANAEKEGKVKNVVLASGSWEHIDYNLYLP
jgi:ABC-type transport system substrate-binding protein